jgi:Flp pilus assembly protein TadG
MGRSRERPRRTTRGEAGQSTVEYALVLLAFLVVIVALATLWRAAADGTVSRLAADAASHTTGQGMLAAMQDALLF